MKKSNFVWLFLIVVNTLFADAKKLSSEDANSGVERSALKCYVCDNCPQPFQRTKDLLMDCTNDGVADIFGTPALPTAVPSILPTVVAADVNKSTVLPTPAEPPVLLTASPVPLTVSPSVAPEAISDLPPALPTAVPAVSIVTPVADEPTPGVVAVPTVSPIVDEQTPQVSPVATPTEPTIVPVTAEQTQNVLLAEPTVESISLGIVGVESNLATSDTNVLMQNTDIYNHSSLGSDNTSTLEGLDTITPITANNSTEASPFNDDAIDSRRRKKREIPTLNQQQCFVMQHKNVQSGVVTISRGCIRRAATQNATCHLVKPAGAAVEVQTCSVCDRDGCNAAGRLNGITVQMSIACFLMYAGKLWWQM